LQIQARVNASGNYRNIAVVAAAQADPVPGNNSDEATVTPQQIREATPVPAAGPWTLMALLTLVTLLAGVALRRRRAG
jgi:MYXO-CTERM domain-containing protein